MGQESPTRRVSRRAGVLGAVLGLAAAGIAAGVATERYLVRRTKRVEDPFVDEPFGELPASRTTVVTTPDGLDLHVELVDPDAEPLDPELPGWTPPADHRRLPTLVFVHGFCLDMGTFHFQRRAFTGRFPMVFFDQPGHGRSGLLDSGEYTLEALAEALDSVLEQVVPDGPVVLVGHSMGGMVIMELAQRWPALLGERVVGVALLSTSAGNLDTVNFGLPEILARFRGPLLPVLRTAGPISAAVVDRARKASTDLAWLLTRRYGFGGGQPSPALVSYVERMNSATSLGVIARYVQTLHEHSRLLALGPLRGVPVLVACGDRDLVTPLEHSWQICQALPGAKLEVLPDSGHVALLEYPDLVNGILADFLSKV